MIALPLYRVRAQNTAVDSENKMHDDRVAAEYGFRGGLVPGVTVYGYMAAPLVEFAPEWLEHGSMSVKFLEPFYDGDEVIVRAAADADGDGSIRVTAGRDDGAVCGSATAQLRAAALRPIEMYPAHPLPSDRPKPGRDSVVPGAPLGTVARKLETAEPRELLQFSNEVLAQNFKLDPWIHVSSEIVNWSATSPGETIEARGRVHDRFDRKGHEFVVIDVMLIANSRRLVQTVRHSAIYRPRTAQTTL